MPQYNVNFELDINHRRCVLGREPQIFHCNHYNTYLQRTILEDAPYIDSIEFLIGAAAEVSYSQFSNIFNKNQTIEDKKRLAQEVFQWAGFGLIDLRNLSEKGGTLTTPVTHYSSCWAQKFGYSKKPVDYFTTGWVAGVMAALYEINPKNIFAKQTACISVEGTKENIFEFSVGTSNFCFHNSVGLGNLTSDEIITIEDNNVDYDGILTALASMPIEGNNDGLIPAFGVILTRHYANYYNRISFEFVRQMHKKFGNEGIKAAEPLLIEAGHQCAFNTFGGIMTSQEWEGLIKPQLRNKKDWVHGIVAVVNALGWGRWQVTNVSEKGAEFILHNDYESVGYEAMYGKSDHPVTYLAYGGITGIMDLVYLCNIEATPNLTPEFYAKYFRGDDVYQAKNLLSRAKGDKVTKYEVYR